jgi:choline dehydrogenase-like flavoprotein
MTGGGWAAKELTEKGLETLVLERGRHVGHGEDYVTEHVGPWEQEFRGAGSKQEWEEDYSVQSNWINENVKHFFVNDRKHPYTTTEDSSFMWIRGYQLGGRSITWGRHSYRWSDPDFEANARDGVAVDWPIRYEDIAPWYDYVEKFAGISGREEGLPHLPDGEFLPPMELNCVEKKVRRQLDEAYDEPRVLTIGRNAVLTEPHNGRAACHYCGPCWRGCSTGSYFSSLSATLPAARETGNLTAETDSIVHRVEYDSETNRATGVRVIDRETEKERAYRGKIVFLCASAMNSVKILLNSTSKRFPNGLANSSGVLGHYLMDHHYNAGAAATFEGFEDKYYFGRRPNTIYIPRFRNLGDRATRQSEFIRGYGFQGGAYRPDWNRRMDMKGLGKDFKDRLRTPAPWRMGLTAFGEILPREENYCELDPKETNQWGLPLLRFNTSIGKNEKTMWGDMKAQAAEMLEAAGGKDVETYDAGYQFGEAIHEMGGARMGRDPDTSVLNKWNQAHDVPNLFVTDGSCMVSSACQNPSLTYMALTARACDYAAKEMKRDNL